MLSPFTPILHVQRLWVSDTERNRDFIVSSCPSESSPLLPEIVAQDKQHRAIVARMKPIRPEMPQEVPPQLRDRGVVGPCSTAGPSEPSVRAQATDIATRLRQKHVARQAEVGALADVVDLTADQTQSEDVEADEKAAEQKSDRLNEKWTSIMNSVIAKAAEERYVATAEEEARAQEQIREAARRELQARRAAEETRVQAAKVKLEEAMLAEEAMRVEEERARAGPCSSAGLDSLYFHRAWLA